MELFRHLLYILVTATPLPHEVEKRVKLLWAQQGLRTPWVFPEDPALGGTWSLPSGSAQLVKESDREIHEQKRGATGAVIKATVKN